MINSMEQFSKTYRATITRLQILCFQRILTCHVHKIYTRTSSTIFRYICLKPIIYILKKNKFTFKIQTWHATLVLVRHFLHLRDNRKQSCFTSVCLVDFCKSLPQVVLFEKQNIHRYCRHLEKIYRVSSIKPTSIHQVY